MTTAPKSFNEALLHYNKALVLKSIQVLYHFIQRSAAWGNSYLWTVLDTPQERFLSSDCWNVAKNVVKLTHFAKLIFILFLRQSFIFPGFVSKSLSAKDDVELSTRLLPPLKGWEYC